MKVTHTAPEQSPSWVNVRGEGFRCRQCQKLLFMHSRNLRLANGPNNEPGWIEIQCRCKTKNYVMSAGS